MDDTRNEMVVGAGAEKARQAVGVSVALGQVA